MTKMTDKRNFLSFRSALIIIFMVLSCCCISACQKNNNAKISLSSEETISQISKETLYIFEAASPDSKKVYLVNAETGADAEFVYNSSTDILSQKGEAILASQLKCGELVRGSYNLKTHELASLHSVEEAWSYDTLGSYIGMDKKMAALYVGDKAFKYNRSLTYYSNGTRINFDDIVEKDKVTVRGLDKTAYSVTVTDGHGKVRITNPGEYLGGWIEVGKAITVISNKTVLDVPDGSYTLRVTRRGYSASKDIVVERDKELRIDLTELEETKVDTCLVSFNITPVEAETSIYIGNSRVDGIGPVELTYGKYYLIIKAEGYNTYGGTVIVGSPTATVSIELEPLGSSGREPAASSGNSSKSSGTTASGGTTTSSDNRSDSNRSSSESGNDRTVMDSSQRQSILQSIQDVQASIQNSLMGMLN